MNRFAASLLAVVIVFVAGFATGREWRDRSADVDTAQRDTADAQAQTKVVADALQTEHTTQAATAPVEQHFAEREEARDVQFRTINRDVIRYVTTYVPDPACRNDAADAEFVRLWNTAARGQGSEPAAAEPEGRR